MESLENACFKTVRNDAPFFAVHSMQSKYPSKIDQEILGRISQFFLQGKCFSTISGINAKTDEEPIITDDSLHNCPKDTTFQRTFQKVKLTLKKNTNIGTSITPKK